MGKASHMLQKQSSGRQQQLLQPQSLPLPPKDTANTYTLTYIQAHQKQKTIANYVRCQPFVGLFTVTVNQQPPPPYPNPAP